MEKLLVFIVKSINCELIVLIKSKEAGEMISNNWLKNNKLWNIRRRWLMPTDWQNGLNGQMSKMA